MKSAGTLLAWVSLPKLWLREFSLRIDKNVYQGTTTVFLIGRFDLEHLEELKTQLRSCQSETILDLNEVTIVDVDVIRFLVTCEAGGAKIVHCARYIREWMLRERQFPGVS